ncbi:hypothetical protein AX14_013607 [Amanita brunnescens Koide BX004]|nr:hypothetical protein AX14_013607 [Amanita brunnescens Koide BX004]
MEIAHLLITVTLIHVVAGGRGKVGAPSLFAQKYPRLARPPAEMVYRKRKRTDNVEAEYLDLPAVGSQVLTPGTMKGGSSTAMEVPQTGLRSEPSIVALNTPSRPSESSAADGPKTRRTRRNLRSSPSLQVISHVSTQGQSSRPLRTSPSLVVIDGPTQLQPPAKRARGSETTVATLNAGETTFVPHVASQALSPQPFPFPTYLASTPETTGPYTSIADPFPTQAAESSPQKGKGKGKRKGKDKESPPEEKRAARFKPKCPQNIMDRVQRVRQQRLFMIDRNRSGDELRETFSVLGSTGNVYTVVIDEVPRCNCPDALKGNHCKHILFVYLKVLRVPESSPHWYQKALLHSELEEIFAQAPLAPNCVAQQHVREALAKAMGQDTGSSSSSNKKRLPTEDDNCPICYETMYGVAENALNFCETCGNALHDECWKQWKASSVRNGKSVTCVWCRAETVPAGERNTYNGGYGNEGYVNLGAIAGCSPVRDTSTYHYRASRKWGYNYRQYEYED